MPFVDYPGYEYDTPFDWHDGDVYVVHVQDGTATYNHDVDVRMSNAPVRRWNSHFASGLYREGFPGTPMEPAADCAWYHASKGHNVGGIGVPWVTGALCPDILSTSPSGTHGSANGSAWGVTAESSGGPFADLASAQANLSGWIVAPWNIFDTYNLYMNDSALHTEYSAALDTKPDGWYAQVEDFFPTYMGYQLCADERISGSVGLRTEPAIWYYDPVGWGLESVDEDLTSHWITGDPADGTVLTEYSGGLQDWFDPPGGFPVATQNMSTGHLISPANFLTGAKTVTCAALDSLWHAAGVPGYNVSGGREAQALLLRAVWRLPRLRWYRELEIVEDVIRQHPRGDERGWGSGTRFYPPPKANRIAGGIQ